MLANSGRCQSQQDEAIRLATERAREAATQSSNMMYELQMRIRGAVSNRVQESFGTNAAQSEKQTKLIEKLKKQGYSDEEIKIMLDPSRGMNGMMDAIAARLKGRALTNVLEGKPAPKSEVEMQNLFRQSVADVATNNPKLFERILTNRNDKVQTAAEMEKWFEREWDSWNDAFEKGTPFNRLMGEKQNADPLAKIPGGAEQSGSTMALVAVNLKGLIVDRELRLQSALTTSSNDEVATWREKLWRLQIESLSSRPSPVNPAAEGFAPREVLKNSYLTIPKNKEIEAAERELRLKGIALPGAGRREVISPSAISEALREDCALVEFVAYGRDLGGINPIEANFGAVVFTKRSGPRWVNLGKASEVSELVQKYVSLMRQSEGSAVSDAEARGIIEPLCAKVWTPIEASLPHGTKRMLIAPDNCLHLVSFATLMRNNRFLCEDFDIEYVSGGRALTEGTFPPKNMNIEIWSDPDFDGDVGKGIKPPSGQTGWPLLLGQTRAFGAKFERLQGTATEASILKNVAAKLGNPHATIHSGASASEASLRNVSSPFILHLGTHGFFLPLQDPGSKRPWETGGIENEFKGDAALYQSGIALVGANRTFAALSRKELPSPENDGILLAAEAAQLNLHGTWLVTVSACDSGAGSVADGESLIGLKLGFFQAGADNLLLSLWRVNDSYTPEFLKAFYERALKTGDTCAALSDVQRIEIRKLLADGGKNSFWRSIKLAGPFTVSSRTL